jgi:hypothetical protein
MKTAYDEAGVQAFIDGLFAGKQVTEPYPKAGLPAIAATTPWDGKDAPVIEEEADDDLMAELLAEAQAKAAAEEPDYPPPSPPSPPPPADDDDDL